MNDFEKAVIGVARTDQALNKAQNIIGLVTFGVVAIAFVGVFVYINHAGKKMNEERAKQLADKAAKDKADAEKKQAQTPVTPPVTPST